MSEDNKIEQEALKNPIVLRDENKNDLEDDVQSSNLIVLPPSSSENQEQCQTPTSEEHKIATIRSCPPTPRKQQVQVHPQHGNYKRKLVEFFENSGRDEVESFFRSNLDQSNDKSRPSKKRCTSI